MQSGRSKTVMTLIDSVYNSQVTKTIIQYNTRLKVADSQEEMTAFLNFLEKLRELRREKRLAHDKEDKSTLPSFTLEYLATDDYYYVILNWCELVL